MKTRTIYRIEHPLDHNGMWYTKDGIPLKRIHILCPNSRAKDLPMPYNEKHRLGGEVWQSAAKSAENMNEWFTPEDALSLVQYGFKLYGFQVSMWQELEHEILFCRKGVLSQKEIPLTFIFDLPN